MLAACAISARMGHVRVASGSPPPSAALQPPGEAPTPPPSSAALQPPERSPHDPRLLVDATEFWPTLSTDIASARERVWVEAMSFEGDSAGMALAAALLACRAADRRVLVDDYTNLCLSDRFAVSPRFWFSRRLQAEVQSTRRMFERLRAGGVEVRFTNPVGRNPFRILTRNHKKMILIDSDVSYLGGINFSDHNFAWHDLMVRYDRGDLARSLARDFDSTWVGRDIDRVCQHGDLTLLSMDGRRNPERFSAVLDSIRAARDSIWVQSPYLSLPFYEALGEARRRGVAVTVITPVENNKGTMDSYTIWEAHRRGIELRHLPHMTHLKAIVIDGRLLVTGSANFDALSFSSQQEVLLLDSDPRLLRQVMERVVRPDVRSSVPYHGDARAVRGRLAYMQLWTLGKLGALVAG